jgi:hypothetical protein
MPSLEDNVDEIIKNNLAKPAEREDFDTFSIVNFYSSADKKHLRDFINTPFYIPAYYTENKNKPFPIYSMEEEMLSNTGKNKNPFFDKATIQYSVAYNDEGKPVGRAASFIDYDYNRENKGIGEGDVGWIGFFESIDDKIVGEWLLFNQETFLKDNGAKQVLGPAQFNANGEIGLLVKGFDNPPFFMEPYHASYYEDFFKNRGYQVRNLERARFNPEKKTQKEIKRKDRWFSFLLDSENLSPKDLKYIELAKNGFQRRNGTSHNASDKLKENGYRYSLREIDIDNFQDDADKILDLYNSVWGKGNHPEQRKLREGEIEKLIDDIRVVSLPPYVLMAEKESASGKKEAVGTLVACLDMNETINQYDSKFKGQVGELFDRGNDSEAYKLISKATRMPLMRDVGILKTHMNKINNTYQGDDKEEFALFPRSVKMLRWLPSTKRARELKKEVYENARVLIMGLKEEDRKKLVAENMMIKFMDNLKKKTPSVRNISGSEVAELNQDIFLMLQKLGQKSLEWNVYHKNI